MSLQFKLEVVDNDPKDSVIDSTPNMGPVIVGNEDEDLLCGACGEVIGKSTSRRTLFLRYAAPHRLTVTCSKCRAYNLIHSTKLPLAAPM